jgi:hypothetical protein
MSFDDILVPQWCVETNAADPIVGCFSLTSGLVRSKAYCRSCAMYKPTPNNSDHERTIINNQRMVFKEVNK